MGAASSVQVDSSDDDEFEYGSQNTFNKPISPTKPPKNIIKKTLDEVIAADDLEESPPSTRKAFTDKNDNKNNNDEMTQIEREKSEKRKGLFGFKKKEEIKVLSPNEESKKGKENQRGFRLFNWKKQEKTSEPKDEKLQEEIEDIEKTFESLGFSEKTTSQKNEIKIKKMRRKSDDIIKLEPMRKKSHIKSKAMNNNISNQQSNSGSKRNFKYSWEQESIKSPVKSENWQEFSLNKIEGFDLEKFKRINAEDDLDSRNITSFTGNFNSQGDASNWNYDRKDKELLASIEREFLPL